MNEENGVINELLVQLFNDVLEVEEDALSSGPLSDLSLTEMHTIEAIGLYTEKTMPDVSETLGITMGTLTTAINKLIKKGYVERKRIPEDRRVVLISLTKKGKLAYMLHEKFHKDMISETVYHLTDEDKKILISSLNKIIKFFNGKKELVKNKEKE